MHRIGVVGTGFIARGLVLALAPQADLEVTSVLTRRDLAACAAFPRADVLTREVDALLEACDLVVECSGDVLHATRVTAQALEAGRPVVTMDAEFHVTTGSYFVGKGILTEAEGDQPGCLAMLREQAVASGFRPLVYGNLKRFLNHRPTREEMRFWSQKQGISLPQVTAFTDGTKVQIEQALVANGLGAGIAVGGLLGLATNDLYEGARTLADGAKHLGYPIADYLLGPNVPAGVFIVAEHDDAQRDYLRYLKLGDGPYYVLLHNYHLCHLEIPKTIRRILQGGRVLLDNSALPSVSVAALAKRLLPPGTRIERGIGSFDVRGETVRIREAPDHVPVGLLAEARLTRAVEPGQRFTFDDVELPESLALTAWREILDTVLHAPPLRQRLVS